MACAAIPMTVVMFLQLILMLVGVGFGSSDGDLDNDGADDGGNDGVDDGGNDSSNPSAARIFTIRGIVAFFALGGWAGLAALTAGVPLLWSVHIALLSGVAAMLLASVVIRIALKMQSSGNLDLRNALSQTAEVYITIPPERSNTGKVTLTLQERFVELDAVTDSDTAIKPNTKVEVIGLAGSDCLVVCPLSTSRFEEEGNETKEVE